MADAILREQFSQLFPDLIFYDHPVSDNSVSGVALIYDEAPVWVVVYDEYLLMQNLRESFGESDDP